MGPWFYFDWEISMYFSFKKYQCNFTNLHRCPTFSQYSAVWRHWQSYRECISAAFIRFSQQNWLTLWKDKSETETMDRKNVTCQNCLKFLKCPQSRNSKYLAKLMFYGQIPQWLYIAKKRFLQQYFIVP